MCSDVWTNNTRNAKINGGSNISVYYIEWLCNIDSNIFFEIRESNITRGHNYTLVKKQSRLDVKKYSFSQRSINVWNNLSTDCVHASSVNMFNTYRMGDFNIDLLKVNIPQKQTNSLMM